MKNTPASESPMVDDRLELLFRHAGLSEKQAKLYRLLLATGEERVSVLSRKSGIKRSNVYALLRDMRIRGLVQEFDKGKIVYFRPESPEKITEIIQGRIHDASLAERLATDLLPSLKTQWKTAIGRPTVRYYEGEEGIKAVFEDIYAPKKDIVYGAVDLEAADQTFPKHIIEKLIPKRIRNKVVAHSFVVNSPQAQAIHKSDEAQLRKTVLLDKKDYPLPAEIDIYEDKVAMLSFEKGEFIGLIVENKAFATTLRSIFKKAFG